MNYITNTTIPPGEKELAKWQNIQWKLGQCSTGAGVFYIAFAITSFTTLYPGIGVYNGIMSALVAAFGLAITAPRPGSAWNASRQKYFMGYGALSVGSLISNIIQIALSAHVISLMTAILASDEFSAKFSVVVSFFICAFVGIILVLLTGILGTIFDFLCIVKTMK